MVSYCVRWMDTAAVALKHDGGMAAFYANLEGYVRLLQSRGANVYLVLGVPFHDRFNPGNMVTRSPTGFRSTPNVEKAIPVAELQVVQATVYAKLRAFGDPAGATLLDPHTDICRSGDGCLPFFGAEFSDKVHLRPVSCGAYALPRSVGS